MLAFFNAKTINPELFTSPETILDVFLNIFRNVDWDLSCNIEELENKKLLDAKQRTFYNYVLCKEDMLCNMRQLGKESLVTKLDTPTNFQIFIKSLYYTGKGIGRRDLMHIGETIDAIISWQDKITKEGGKIHTCMRALLESSGIVIVTAFNDSSTHMSHNRESAIIDFVGLDNLTNIYNGSRYGNFTKFGPEKSKNYGQCALYVFFRNYLTNGAIPFTMEDIVRMRMRSLERSSDRNCQEDFNENICNHDHIKCIGCNKTI